MISQTIQQQLRARVQTAVDGLPGVPADFAVEVSAAADTRFGDYQTNAAMLLAKILRQSPRQVAAALLERLSCDDLSETPEIAGAGFVNFRLRKETINTRLQQMLADPRLGVPPSPQPATIVIDFSAPNVAKPMHVGHIRSTVLGDALARIARFLGHEVITDNHIGDWGTQFGKVIYGWKNLLDGKALATKPVEELVRLYREVNRLSEADPAVLTTCREELVKLQAGDAENVAIWQEIIALSRVEFQDMYNQLGITFDQTLGESFYNDALAPMVEELKSRGIAQESEGALCVFFPDDPRLAEKPCLVRKSDGGFLYATTDLATIEYRVKTWKPDVIWYVVGSPQLLHLEQVFAIAKRMGYATQFEHIAFGSILGEDRKLMKTRSGENVALRDVLDDAVERAAKLVAAKNPEMPPEEQREIAAIIGIGAVKYAELSQHRMTDYIFSWDKMLSFQGNASYLQNACVRILSIFRRFNAEVPAGAVSLDAVEERALGIKLAQFGETVPEVLSAFRPNLLANYLYQLAGLFHGFFEACPVLKEEEPVRSSRLRLCRLTLNVLRQGLDLLGIEAPERM